MLKFVFLFAAILVIPSQSWLVDNVIDFFFNSFDGDKYQNVGIGKTIECGTVTNKDGSKTPRDCLILCDKTNSCANSTFKVSDANIQIICQKPSSCANVYISAQYTQSLNMSFMATNAFLNGFFIGVGNERVITQCSFGESCKESTFYHNNDAEVVHNCSAWNGPDWSSYGACRHSKIVTLGGKVTLDFSNKQAFYPGAYHGYQNEEVTTYCRSDDSCSSAIFHYDSWTPVKHYCSGKNGCAGAIIHALTRTDVDCAGKKSHSSTYSCYETAMISATNNYSVTVHGYDYAPERNRLHLYVTPGSTADELRELVTCADDCEKDRAVYYAANDYLWERNCSMEHADSCLDELADSLRSDPFTVHDNYYWDSKGRIDEVWSGGALLTLYSRFPAKQWSEYMYRSDPKYQRLSLTAPRGLEDYSVLCMDCQESDFHLGEAANAVIYTTSHKAAYSSWIGYNYIESSSNEFTFIGGDTDTNITINATGSNAVDIVNIGRYSSIYLGDVEDVNIECWYSLTCIGVDVYTDINPMEVQPFSPHSEFQMECDKVLYGESACEWWGGYPRVLKLGLYINFSFLNKRCRISRDGPDVKECPFLSYYVRSEGTSDAGGSHAVSPYVIGASIAGVLVLFAIVAGCVFYRARKKKKISAQLYVNLTESNAAL